MAGGRPRKPVEQKQLEGTYRKDRDAKEESTQIALRQSHFLLERKSLPCPPAVTDEYVKKAWRTLAKRELSVHRLADIDVPHMEQMFLVLQRARKVYQDLLEAEADDDDERAEKLERRWLSLTDKFSSMAKSYDITPAARAKLTLDELGAVKAAQDIQKGADGITAVLGMRK